MGQVGAGGIRQDLLNDGGHHSLVVAVSAARATGGGDPKSGKKSASGRSPASPPPRPLSPGLSSPPTLPLLLPKGKGGSWLPDGLGAGTGHAQPSLAPLRGSFWVVYAPSAGQDEAWG